MQSFSLLTAVTLASVAVGQVNPFVFYPQDPERQTITCTSFVGRPWTNQAAEALMEIDQRHFRGVADANGPIRLFGVYHWAADERLSTVETYSLVIRDGALNGGGPDMSASAEFVRIANLTTPPSPSTARGTWILSDGFGIGGGLFLNSSPARYYVGVDLPANPAWPFTDGHALFRADLINSGSGALVGENHRAGAPNPTWSGRHALPPFSTPWTYILGPLVTSPNLHVGGIDPTSSRLGASGANLGMNGLFPDISGPVRFDGFLARVTDNLAPFGFVAVGAAFGFQPPHYFGNLLPGTLIGFSHIGSGTGGLPILISFGALTGGALDVPLATPGSVATALQGTDVVLQAIVWDTNINLSEWTNAQAVHL